MRLLATLLCWLLIGATIHAAEKPNFVFILSDDLAMGDVGAYGQKLIQTPHLDRMAAEGTRYLQAYCGTSVCAPSRSSLMTGLHMGHCPIRANREAQPEGQKPLPAGTYTVAKLLDDQGYATACIGKWGMGMFDTTGSPLKVGFDHFYGYNCQRHAHSYFPTYLYNDDQRFELPGNTGKGVGETYAQDLIADETVRWIREHKDEPFFLFYSITLPHGKYEIDDLGPYADRDWSEKQKSYAAMVSRLDSDVGRVLDLLRELELDDDTLVIMAGDNGSSFAPNSEIGKLFDQTMGGQLRGFKRGMYEGALRQAAIAWWPGTVSAGRVTDEPWAFWDYLPTVAELTGTALRDPARENRFAVVINRQEHPELYEMGGGQVGDASATQVPADDAPQAVWVPIAVDQKGESVVANASINGLIRQVERDGKAVTELLVAAPNATGSISGARIAEASRSRDFFGEVNIALKLDQAGGEQMRELTSAVSPKAGATHYTHLAIVFEGEVQSAPTINDTIGSELQIAGRFSAAEIDHLLNVLAAKQPATDGHSLAAFLKGGAAPQREYFYWELHEGKPIQAVRFGNWKAVRNGPDAAIELYDLKSDASESHNVAAEHSDLVTTADRYLTEAHTPSADWPLQGRQR
ncbi:MAG: sulfatase-like hydrolase/transferase [Planctomycetaceae bacterium]